MEIKEALKKLDHKNDGDWTGDGLPLVEGISLLVGREVERKEITDADPLFSRSVASAAMTMELPEEEKQEPKQEQKKPSEKDILENDKAILEKRIEKCDDEIIEQTRNIQQAKNKIDEVIVTQIKFQEELNALKVNDDNPIQVYLKRQNEIRLEKSKRRAIVLSKIDPSDLNAKSQLDLAMNNRPKRGGKRPSRV